MSFYEMLTEWETATEPPSRNLSFGLHPERVETRIMLVMEESIEVANALAALSVDLQHEPFGGADVSVFRCKRDLLKELCDLQYVLTGTLVALDIPKAVFDEAFRRVHESNMSKRGDDGNFIFREDGKVLKGPNYKLADLSDLADQF